MTPQEHKFRCHYLGDFASEPKSNPQKQYADAVAKMAELQMKIAEGKKLGSIQAKDILELPELIKDLKPLKDKIVLSNTANKRLHKIKREIQYGIIENLDNKYTQKGLICEDDGISLHSKLEGVYFTKNTERFANDLICGEPDILFNKKGVGRIVDDNKCSWNAQSFDDTNSLKKIYYWQLTGYMWLCEADYARVVHVLVNTPPELVIAEHNNILYKHKPQGMSLDEFSYSEAGTKIRTQIFRNHTYTDSGWIEGIQGNEFLEKDYWEALVATYLLDPDYKFIPIPDEQRRKIFSFKRNEEDIAYIKQKLTIAKHELIRLCEDNTPLIYDLTKEDCDN